MSNAIFPSLPGLTWEIKRTPTFLTLVQAAANGRSVRVPLRADPMWRFECSFEFLRDDAQHDELNQLLGFFLARQGSFDSFLLDLSTLTQNPDDAFIKDQPLTADANLCAPLVRTLGSSGYPEAIYELQGTPVIKARGIVQIPGLNYNLFSPSQNDSGLLNANGISYAGYVVKFTAPVDTVTADFGWYYRVIFSSGKNSNSDPPLGNDQQEFSMLLHQLYEAQSITMVTARE